MVTRARLRLGIVVGVLLGAPAGLVLGVLLMHGGAVFWMGRAVSCWVR